MSTDFCNRVVDASRNIKQCRPFSIRALWSRAGAILPMQPHWAIAMMAAVFVIGLTAGMESYDFVYSADITELMEI